MPFNKICIGCGKRYMSKRTDKKYCNRKCYIKNHKTWNEGLKFPRDKYPNCGMTGKTAWNKGISNPELSKRQTENNVATRPEVRKKIKEGQLNYYAKGNHPVNYIDGSSRNRKYRLARWLQTAKEVYERDNYTCQVCGKKGGLLNAHHILPWAGNPELAFDKDNIITLCVPCHSKIHIIEKGALCESQEVSHENNNLVR